MITVLFAASIAEAEPLDPGCVATIAELSVPAANDPRLLHDRLIVVRKSERRLLLFSNGQLRHDRSGGGARCWSVALGVNDEGVYPPGPKDREGDRKTPEGWYWTSDKPWSAFHGAIYVHYPNTEDAAGALASRRIDHATYDRIAAATRSHTLPPQTTRLGGEILIHGGRGPPDWTWGCVGLDDRLVDELRAALPPGMHTDVLILP